MSEPVYSHPDERIKGLSEAERVECIEKQTALRCIDIIYRIAPWDLDEAIMYAAAIKKEFGV